MPKLLSFAVIAVVLLATTGCTSISCRYGTPEPGDVLPPDLPLGATLRTVASLVGLLDESIDDSSVHYLNLVVPPGYRNRFVKQRIDIRAGTLFQVVGYRRPFNPLCYSHDWDIVLSSRSQLTANRDEIHIKVPLARSNMVVERKAVAQNQQQPLVSPLDAVAFYIIPTDDVAEQAIGTIARALTKDTGLWIKSTVWAPSDVSEPLPGTNQYPAEDYFPVGARVARTLRDASPNTYFIVLTSRDINSKTLNFRFQYSMHSPTVNTSVLSIARLPYNVDGSRATENVAAERVTKMLMRIVGEMRLGWKRTSDPMSLMYAPVMSIEDIDRMSLSYTMKSHNTGE